MISGFQREVGEDWALLGYYAVISSNFLVLRNDHSSVRNNPEKRSSQVLKRSTDSSTNYQPLKDINPQNVAIWLPTDAASHPRRTES